MELKDLIITPLYLAMILVFAVWLRPLVTTPVTKKYFIPALTAKLLGALALGVIYQFYYSGGDTFNYFRHGSRWIWEALLENPLIGIQLLFEEGGQRQPETFMYSQNIWYYKDVKSFLIVRITAMIDVFTFHTYSSTTLFFAVFSFSGLWVMYQAIHKRYPDAKYLHIAILFIPSVVFWGSGILKDTVTLGALGWLTWAVVNVFLLNRKWIISVLVALLMSAVIVKIKPYIFLCYVPNLFVLAYLLTIKKIHSAILKVMLVPVLLLIMGTLGYIAVDMAATKEYSLDNIAHEAAVTSHDIRYGWGARTGGDGGYDLGTLDGSWQSMISLLPSAIVVSLFRPFLWEVKNPLMLLSAIEALAILSFTIRILWKVNWFKISWEPFVLFCLAFSLLFAFAVGVSTSNFGTLMRYKTPMMIHYCIFLALLRRS